MQIRVDEVSPKGEERKKRGAKTVRITATLLNGYVYTAIWRKKSSGIKIVQVWENGIADLGGSRVYLPSAVYRGMFRVVAGILNEKR